ncbi:MAG: polyphosphate kinase 1 [Magnetovibrionaceae bacterium]
MSPDTAPNTDLPTDASSFDLNDPQWYLNRELTWLEFNRRVLNEARDKRTPLLERVKFVAIVSGNLDEFAMKRIGGLKQQVGAGVHDRSVDGRTAAEQIAASNLMMRELLAERREIYLGLIKELGNVGIHLCDYGQLSANEQAKARQFYVENVFPLVTPLGIDPAHPFPFISNLSLNLLVTLASPDGREPMLVRIKVPAGVVPRFVEIEQEDGEAPKYVPLEQVMAHNLDLLFPKMDVISCEAFRVTRNANTELDEEEAGDLLSMIETELRDRKFAPIVRMQVEAGIDPVHRGMLAAELGLDEEMDVFEDDVTMGLRDLWQIVGIDRPELKDPPHHPIDNVWMQEDRPIFHIIRDAGNILLHHPYESFTTSVVRFVQEAARDPKVLGIKMTLYRTSSDTRIIDYLIEAARNGKQVAVVVELKARFDEEANIRWANRMEEIGIHVTYGVVGLKTHSKLVQVLRKDYNGLRRYCHIGTGNYHAGTARLYSDLGLLTCDTEIGTDLTELFNYLTTGCTPARKYNKLLVAPKTLKKGLLDRIDREIKLHSSKTPGLIRLKTNALEDADIARALYKASQAGVEVELLVRDTCRVRPGLKGLSENIKVVGIVGRFLEHARIYYFQNGGEEEYFIGSADLMRRNLESRVEVITPVEQPSLQAELKKILDLQMSDPRQAWDMQADGSYVQRNAGRSRAKGCQQQLIDMADKRNKDANKIRKSNLQALARRAAK